MYHYHATTRGAMDSAGARACAAATAPRKTARGRPAPAEGPGLGSYFGRPGPKTWPNPPPRAALSESLKFHSRFCGNAWFSRRKQRLGVFRHETENPEAGPTPAVLET